MRRDRARTDAIPSTWRPSNRRTTRPSRGARDNRRNTVSRAVDVAGRRDESWRPRGAISDSRPYGRGCTFCTLLRLSALAESRLHFPTGYATRGLTKRICRIYHPAHSAPIFPSCFESCVFMSMYILALFTYRQVQKAQPKHMSIRAAALSYTFCVWNKRSIFVV